MITNKYIENLINTMNNRDAEKDADIILKKTNLYRLFNNDRDLIDLLHLSDNSFDNIQSHILPYLKLNGIKDYVGNYILFDINDIGVSYTNDAIKNQELTIICLIEEKDMDTEFLVPICNEKNKSLGNIAIQRHDLMSYIIRDLLNRSNIFGKQLKLTSNQVDIFDAKYYGRTLKFLIKAPNVDQGGGNKYAFYNRSSGI